LAAPAAQSRRQLLRRVSGMSSSHWRRGGGRQNCGGPWFVHPLSEPPFGGRDFSKYAGGIHPSDAPSDFASYRAVTRTLCACRSLVSNRLLHRNIRSYYTHKQVAKTLHLRADREWARNAGTTGTREGPPPSAFRTNLPGSCAAAEGTTGGDSPTYARFEEALEDLLLSPTSFRPAFLWPRCSNTRHQGT